LIGFLKNLFRKFLNKSRLHSHGISSIGYSVARGMSELDPWKCRAARKDVDKVQPDGAGNVPGTRRPAPRKPPRVVLHGRRAY